MKASGLFSLRRERNAAFLCPEIDYKKFDEVTEKNLHFE